MFVTSLPSRILLLATVFTDTFLPWYIIEQPAKIVRMWWGYTKAVWDIFGILFLIKTLLSPWKSITDAYPSNGLDFNRIIQAFTLNCTSRCVGFVIRLASIVTGLTVLFAVSALFAVYFAVWMTFPILAAFALQFLFGAL